MLHMLMPEVKFANRVFNHRFTIRFCTEVFDYGGVRKCQEALFLKYANVSITKYRK